jgi:hypothetical protein
MSKMVPVVKPITPATVATTTAEKEFGGTLVCNNKKMISKMKRNTRTNKIKKTMNNLQIMLFII